MSPRKVLILGILLLVPIFFYFFLRIFGSNQYHLRTFFPVIDENTEEPVVQNGDTLFQKVPDFKLTSQTGKSISQADLDNSVYVANFFFASCKDVCKKMSTQLSRVQEAFLQDPSVKIVSYTVDPERDSVGTLRKYAQTYDADSTKWYFLTGPKPAIYQLAQQGYKLAVMEAPSVTPDFIHSEKFILVDKQKHVRGIYDGTKPEDVDRLITEIRLLLKEK
ncbi:SCO family protein [Adhaeribacter aquaticus]|uniref:SCO family protein n=1 Tax=Adhaeribacter aquaticus TaxID=299567 RepID=UPI00040AC486|nr:SCO family protein [Adhaeribacter aquaticus]